MPSDLSFPADFSETLERLLRGPKPGLSAQMEMSPVPGPGTAAYPGEPPDCLRAAVLVLIYPNAGAPHIVFIRRPGTSLHHRNQIAFPGGQIEAGESEIQAALREAREEVGLPEPKVRTAGTLTPLYVAPSNYGITPVVGSSAEPVDFTPFADEVAEIIEIPLAHLLDPAHIRREMWLLERGRVLVPFYDFGPHKIWGATAMILAEFLAILKTGGGVPGPDPGRA